ncbi:hypothetical protein FQA47_023955 [Oryzias melastigma]|uniref:Uncharacterized protein n=1 Tax=Oryzias melastigma TaxID=30732 RepID=A0A834L3G1_ORYME|nr:hypothetical protein FQA47_023955 [Oryzias melastigma]
MASEVPKISGAVCMLHTSCSSLYLLHSLLQLLPQLKHCACGRDLEAKLPSVGAVCHHRQHRACGAERTHSSFFSPQALPLISFRQVSLLKRSQTAC